MANFIYFFFKLLPTKNKITFISRQSNVPSVDMILIENKLPKDIKVVKLCKMLESGIVNKIKYLFHMIVQMYHIATSKIVVLDTYCILIGILKHKKSLKVIQMWHALGSFKKFGKSIIDTNDMLENEQIKDVPIWEFLEIISFGELISFYNMFAEKYELKKQAKRKYMLIEIM